MKGHTGSLILPWCLLLALIEWSTTSADIGALTVLWSQPVSALQLRTHDDGEWRYVKHIDNALVI